MGKGTLTIYGASAGSGKTYTLTEIYLTSLFRSRYDYRKILAVTFTNKATAEMKSRILDNLHKLAKGKPCDYLEVLMKATGKDEDWIRKESGEILNAVLHDFSRFSISTIDSFFQKILRAFAREAGLHAGFNVELDHSIILSDAVDEMIKSAVEGTQLNRWLIRYALTNIEEDKSWNLKGGIIKLAEELFREKFKIFAASERPKLENKEFLLGYIEKLKSLTGSFEKKLTGLGRRAEGIYSEYGLSDEMFYRKGQGVPGFIRFLVAGSVKEPNSYVCEIEKSPPRWSTGPTATPLQNAIASGLDKVLLEAITFYRDNIMGYKTANSILSNIYALGILSDVLYHIRIITAQENSFLLSDAGELISLITQGDQSPFIYEKVGNRYENFMIDEFQDTSIIQWNNIKPLIDNSMSEGFDNLVVGDVKQSIYRWRNSDWQILGSTLARMVDNERYFLKPLTKNWRSRSNLIKFNNSLFSIIPARLDKYFEGGPSPISLKSIYSEAVQSDPGNKEGGYVRIEFIENEKDDRWSGKVLDRLPGLAEKLQDSGYSASDIGILVRDGKEGASVLKEFIDYSSACGNEKRQNYNYNVVSSDSLLLSNSPAVNFIVSVIAALNDPADMISRALMLRLFLLAKGNPDAGNISIENGKIAEVSRSFFPDGYESFLERLKELPLFEATESIIGYFGIGEISSNVPYLNTFQDYVVSFTGNKSSDTQAFLEWWETTGSLKSVVLPGNQNAMRILTIHKSKGLEFKVVIVPFLSWDLDHKPSKQPYLWVKPAEAPFSEIGVVPVKYNSELENTYFAESYYQEKHSVYIDNVNLLYVALTRAKDVIYGFSLNNPRSDKTIAGVLKNSFAAAGDIGSIVENDLSRYFDPVSGIFELGEIPEVRKEIPPKRGNLSGKYIVSRAMDSLRLKLHGENYFTRQEQSARDKINYGRLMHEVFEGITSASDIKSSVRQLVIEGKLPENESAALEIRIGNLIGTTQAAEWFLPENEILTEAGILLPSGNTRRPDRVIFKDGKTIIVDFKFGEESLAYAVQLDQYRNLLSEMGYSNIGTYIWYVDRNLIVPV